MKNWNYTYPRPLLKRDSFLSLNGTWLLNDIEIEIPIVKEFVLDEYALTNSKLFIYKKEFNLPKYNVACKSDEHYKTLKY